MSFIVFIATVGLFALGVWLLSVESFWVRLIAILPLLGSFSILLESVSWLGLSEKVTRVALLIVVAVWGAALVSHKKDKPGKVVGAIVLIVAIYAFLGVIGVNNLWLAQEISSKTVETLGNMFSWANNAYIGKK
ncbi:MAG: hypothetical protein ABIP74_04465 [Candidatus Saccharimonas sp.]